MGRGQTGDAELVTSLPGNIPVGFEFEASEPFPYRHNPNIKVPIDFPRFFYNETKKAPLSVLNTLHLSISFDPRLILLLVQMT